MATTVQSVLLKKNHFGSRVKASAWIRKHDFKVSINPNPNKEDKTHYRYRQVQPGEFKPKSFRTKKINQHVSLIVGILKKKST